MESEVSMKDLVARVDPEVDRIEGLITVTAREADVLALVTSRRDVPSVRQELLRLGVPAEVLEVQPMEDAETPFPVTDERLRRWLAEIEEEGDLDVAVSVKGPEMSFTPRGIGKVVLILVIGSIIVSMLVFVLLMLFDRLVG